MSRGDGSDALASLARTAEVVSGRPLGREARDQFGRYLDLVISWNRVQRLTALDSSDAIIRGLFEDSLLFLPLLPSRPAKMLDIGAGAGVPGLPLRIIEPGISLTLIESKRKRVSFLRTVVRALALEDVMVIEGRAESIIVQRSELAGSFDVAVARAVGPVSALQSVAKPYLKPNGLFIASGPPVARDPGQLYPGVMAEVVEYPELGLRRSFLVARAR